MCFKTASLCAAERGTISYCMSILFSRGLTLDLMMNWLLSTLHFLRSTSPFPCTHLSPSHFLSHFLIFSETNPASATFHARKISPFCAICQPSFPSFYFCYLPISIIYLDYKIPLKKGYFCLCPAESSPPYPCYYRC